MYNFGLRLLSLSDSGNIEDLYQIIYNNLSPLLIKGYYPVSDNDLFNDFIERFTDKYYNRYLNFNTYGELYIKLKFVLENNKIKYNRIWELYKKQFDPLITYQDKETIKEDTMNTGEMEGETNSSTNSAQKRRGDDKTINTTSFQDRENETTFTPEGSETNATTTDKSNGGIKTIMASTSNPQTSMSADQLIRDERGLKYLDAQQITETDNNYKVETSFKNRKDTTVNKFRGEEKNISTLYLNTDYTTDGTAAGTNKANTKDIKDSTITRVKEGFNGNQMELLDLYRRLIFDMNNEIIKDIDEAHLFMTTLA